MNWAQSLSDSLEQRDSNTEPYQRTPSVPPIRMHEFLQGNARIDTVLVPEPWLPSNSHNHTEWQVCVDGIGGNGPFLTSRMQRAVERRAARVAEIVNAIHAWTLTNPPEAKRIYLSALRKRFGISESLQRAVDDALAEQPWATPERRDDGVLRSWCFVPRSVGAMPLRDLVAKLPSDADAAGPRGRRSVEGRAGMTGLTAAQREAAQSVVSLVEKRGEAFGLDASDGPAVLACERLPELVAQMSDAAAAEKAQVRGARWSPELNTMRPKLVGAATNLLHLARVHQLAARRSPDDTLPPVVAPELRETLQRIRRKLEERARADGTLQNNALRIRCGVTTLGRLLSRRGWFSLTSVDLEKLVSDFVEATKRGWITENETHAVRHVWRRLHSLQHRPLPNARTDAELFSDTLVREAIEARPSVRAVVLAASDSPHVRPGGASLLDGPYGLRRVIEFLTLSPDELGIRCDLPAQRIGVKSARAHVALSDTDATLTLLGSHSDGVRDADPIADATVTSYASSIRRLAQALRGLGAPSPSLDDCCSPESLQRVATAKGWITTNERSAAVLSSHGSEVVESITAVLWASAQLALHDGDRERARHSLEARRRLSKWKQRLAERGAKDESALKLKQVIGIDRVWRGNDNVAGFIKLGRLRDCIIGRLERHAGLPLKEQVAHLFAHPTAPWATKSWALAVRNALLVHIVRFAPLRSRELVRLRCEMLTATRYGVPCAVWETGATVEFDVPAAIMKSKRNREGTFASETDDAETEGRFLRDLWALYLMPGGARETLCKGSDLLFPSTRAKRRLGAASLSNAFRTEVLRYAGVLGMTRSALESMYGATGLHGVRALVGRYVAHDLGNPAKATVLLHHSSIEFTMRRYVGFSARSTRVELPN